MRLSVKIESTIIDVFNLKKWNICCCGSEKCALSHGVGVSQGPVHDCMYSVTKCTEIAFKEEPWLRNAQAKPLASND